MKTFVSLVVVGLAIVLPGTVWGESAPESMMAEMEKCAVCKYMAEKPELMKDMAWETHKIEKGMLCVVSVPKELNAEFDAVSAKMSEAIDQMKVDMEEGKEVELCRFCVSMGELMRLDAKEEHIDTATGAIHLVTSDDPAVVAKIHAVADKAIADQKKMKEPHTASVQ